MLTNTFYNFSQFTYRFPPLRVKFAKKAGITVDVKFDVVKYEFQIFIPALNKSTLVEAEPANYVREKVYTCNNFL